MWKLRKLKMEVRPAVQNSRLVSDAQQVCEQPELHETLSQLPTTLNKNNLKKNRYWPSFSTLKVEWAHCMETNDKNRTIMVLLLVLTPILILGLQPARQVLLQKLLPLYGFF